MQRTRHSRQWWSDHPLGFRRSAVTSCDCQGECLGQEKELSSVVSFKGRALMATCVSETVDVVDRFQENLKKLSLCLSVCEDVPPIAMKYYGCRYRNVGDPDHFVLEVVLF